MATQQETMSKEPIIVLRSSDGVLFDVDEAVVRQSLLLSRMIDDGCAKNAIPIVNVTGNILAKVIEYCKKHVVVVDGGDDTPSVEDLKRWDAEFMQTDVSTIFDIVLAAHYFDIQSLLDLTCQAISDNLAACKDPYEIRAKFNIVKDFSPGEEASARRENAWAFD